MQTRWMVVVGLGALLCSVVSACGDDDGRSGSPGIGGDGGAPPDDPPGTGGTLGAGATGGSTTSGHAGAGADGGEVSEPAGGMGGHSPGEPDAGAPSTPSGGSASEEPGGSGGAGGDSTPASGGFGGDGPASGASGAGPTDAGAGGTNSGVGGAGGSGGAEGEPARCNDGVLSPGELCCTPEWVNARVELVTALVGAGLSGVTSCIPPSQELGVDICGTPACPEGATGCRVEITGGTMSYLPATSEVVGTADVVIRGRLRAEVLGFARFCDFVATIDQLEYRADLVTATTAETLNIRLGSPDLDYTVDVGNCSVLGEVAEVVLNAGPTKDLLEAPIRRALTDQLTLTETCPY